LLAQTHNNGQTKAHKRSLFWQKAKQSKAKQSKAKSWGLATVQENPVGSALQGA
jgi:hypothetical protein